jgi:hypothetical protein
LGRGGVKLGPATSLDIATHYFDANKDLPGMAGHGFNSTQRQEAESLFLTARLKHLVTDWWDAQVSSAHAQNDSAVDADDKEASSGSRLDEKIDIAEVSKIFASKTSLS